VRGVFLASNHVRPRRQAVRALLGQIAEHAELNVVTILVTGSAGHLGEALMRRLRAEHRPARGVDIKPSPFTDCVGSIGDRDFINACMPGVRTVIHAASVHKPHVATHSKRDFVDINILGTLALLEEAVASGVEAFIFTSTTSAFGAALTPAAGEPAVWVTEEVRANSEERLWRDQSSGRRPLPALLPRAPPARHRAADLAVLSRGR
jgi:nucleoside-diphosphate-sugar epimerase